jgi:DNA-binding PadR family transcriptional regulator
MTETVANDRRPTPSADVTPAMFHILLALADGPRHGYGIMQEVERSTHGEMRLPPGTLYRSIKRLLDDGLIDESDGPDDDDIDERRRYYELTADGHAVAVGEARRLAEIVGLARAKNLLDGHEGV